MAKSKNIISGIDINRSGICYTQFLADERKVANIGIQPIEKDQPDYLQAIKDGLDELAGKFAMPKDNIISVLPGDAAIIKKIFIDADENDIDGAIRWELSQQIVSSIDEYTCDYQPLARHPGDGVQPFLVVAYRSSTIAAFTKALKSKKIVPEVLDIDIFALINSYEVNYPETLSEVTCIIYSDGGLIKIIVTQNGQLIDYEILDNIDSAASDEDYYNHIIQSLDRVMGYSSRIVGNVSPHLYLSGSYFSAPEILGELKKRIASVEILQPFRSLQCNPGIDLQRLRDYAPHLAVSVGLAIRNDKERQ